MVTIGGREVQFLRLNWQKWSFVIYLDIGRVLSNFPKEICQLDAKGGPYPRFCRESQAKGEYRKRNLLLLYLKQTKGIFFTLSRNSA